MPSFREGGSLFLKNWEYIYLIFLLYFAGSKKGKRRHPKYLKSGKPCLAVVPKGTRCIICLSCMAQRLVSLSFVLTFLILFLFHYTFITCLLLAVKLHRALLLERNGPCTCIMIVEMKVFKTAHCLCLCP